MENRVDEFIGKPRNALILLAAPVAYAMVLGGIASNVTAFLWLTLEFKALP